MSLVLLKADMIKVQLDLVTRLFLVHTLPLATCSQGVELPLMYPSYSPNSLTLFLVQGPLLKPAFQGQNPRWLQVSTL